MSANVLAKQVRHPVRDDRRLKETKTCWESKPPQSQTVLAVLGVNRRGDLPAALGPAVRYPAARPRAARSLILFLVAPVTLRPLLAAKALDRLLMIGAHAAKHVIGCRQFQHHGIGGVHLVDGRLVRFDLRERRFRLGPRM